MDTTGTAGAPAKERIDWALAPEDLRELAEELGEEAAERLVELFGGATLYIPKRETLIRAKRDHAIRKLYYNGAQKRVLARKYHLSDRQLRRILGRLPEREPPEGTKKPANEMAGSAGAAGKAETVPPTQKKG